MSSPPSSFFCCPCSCFYCLPPSRLLLVVLLLLLLHLSPPTHDLVFLLHSLFVQALRVAPLRRPAPAPSARRRRCRRLAQQCSPHHRAGLARARAKLHYPRSGRRRRKKKKRELDKATTRSLLSHVKVFQVDVVVAGIAYGEHQACAPVPLQPFVIVFKSITATNVLLITNFPPSSPS